MGSSSQHHGVLLSPVMPDMRKGLGSECLLVCTGCCHVWQVACSVTKVQVAGYAQAHNMSSGTQSAKLLSLDLSPSKQCLLLQAAGLTRHMSWSCVIGGSCWWT